VAVEALPPLAALLRLEAESAAEVPGLCDALYAAAGERDEEGGAAAARRRLDVVALRRAVHNRRQVPPPLLAAVSPHLEPALRAALARHLARRQEAAEQLAAYHQAFRADLARTSAALVATARRPLFEEGIRLVGRSLLGRLRGLAPAAVPGRLRHDERHALAKLTSYAARFTTKTSPNSVFCATAPARIGGGEPVCGENRLARLDLLLNVAEARKVTACLGADRALWPAVVPRPNPTLRRTADGGWTFWRPSSPREESDEEVLSQVGAQPVVDLFLEAAGRGELAVPDLLAAVAATSGFPAADLAGFFARLVEKGILIAELEIPYGERRPLAFLAGAVRAAGGAPPWLAEVEAIEREVGGMADLDSAARIAAMDRVEERLRALPHTRPIQGDELFRLDAASALSVALPEAVVRDLEPALGRYARLFAALYPERALRADWVRIFRDRYPADADVELLDCYRGMFQTAGSGQRPAGFPAPPGDAPEAVAAFARAREFFASRALASAAEGGDEVGLDEAAWESLLGGAPEPEWTAGVLFQVAAASPAELAAGRFRIAVNALFTGSGVALARFAHLHGAGAPDERIVCEIAKGWSRLGRPGAILAEVTYTHRGRTANAGLRPAIFRHEIELLGERASPAAEAIPLTDLVVRYDSGEGRFVLRSVARDVEVVPVISSGINPEGFVSFLVEIGRQGLQPLAYFPGFEVAGVKRWPRFVAGRVVLFRRRWVFAPGAGPRPPRPGAVPEEAAAEFFLAVARWRHEHGLPRHVFVHTAAEPKPFYVDLEAPLCVELLRRAIVSVQGGEPPVLHVTEMLPAPDELWVRDGEGRYAAEFLLHLHGPR
jgi:lantibiotic biosynthesis dehydratase-like protein